MNKARRKELANLHQEIHNLINTTPGKNKDALTEHKGKIDDIRSQVESVSDEEQEYFDAMPDGLRGGDKGAAAEAAVDALGDAIQFLDDAMEKADDAIDVLDEEAEHSENAYDELLEELAQALDEAASMIDDASA